MKNFKQLTLFLIIIFCGAFCLELNAAEVAQSNQSLTLLDRTDQFLDQLGQPIALSDDEEIRIRFDGEFRYRFEYRDDFNFNDATFEDDGFSLLRTRLGMHADITDYVHLYVQAQDSESFASREAHKSRAFVNRLDLHQLYAEIKFPSEKIPLKVKVGRQELSYGDQRFVGAFGWSNVARVFDAVKVIFEPVKWFKADFWFSQVVVTNRSQPDSANHDDNFYGIYTTLSPINDHLLDTFLFIRQSRDRDFRGELGHQVGSLKEYTVGNRLKGKKWGFDYGIEWAAQFGSRAHNDIRAWAWHNEIGYTFADLLWTPRIHFEYNYGSGDSDHNDGNVEDFDNLFPTNHIHYGFMDFVSLKNTHNFSTGASVKPHKKVKFLLNYHWFFLDTNGSSWFNAGQGVIRRSNPAASTTVGQELDLLTKWKISKHLSLMVGYSHFHAGAFVDDTGASNHANFFYTMSSLKF